MYHVAPEIIINLKSIQHNENLNILKESLQKLSKHKYFISKWEINGNMIKKYIKLVYL